MPRGKTVPSYGYSHFMSITGPPARSLSMSGPLNPAGFIAPQSLSTIGSRLDSVGMLGAVPAAPFETRGCMVVGMIPPPKVVEPATPPIAAGLLTPPAVAVAIPVGRDRAGSACLLEQAYESASASVATTLCRLRVGRWFMRRNLYRRTPPYS